MTQIDRRRLIDAEVAIAQACLALGDQLRRKGFDARVTFDCKGAPRDYQVWIQVSNGQPFQNYAGAADAWKLSRDDSMPKAFDKADAAIAAVIPRNAYDADFLAPCASASPVVAPVAGDDDGRPPSLSESSPAPFNGHLAAAAHADPVEQSWGWQ